GTPPPSLHHHRHTPGWPHRGRSGHPPGTPPLRPRARPCWGRSRRRSGPRAWPGCPHDENTARARCCADRWVCCWPPCPPRGGTDMDLSIEAEKVGDVVVLHVAGEVYVFTAPQLREALVGAI